MSDPIEAQPSSTKQSIEQLQQRYQTLNNQKIRAETNLESAKRLLDQLKREAQEKFGTNDVDALRQKLAEMTADNENKRSEYQSQLDRIEGELAAVEQKFAKAENPAAAGAEPPDVH